MLMGGWRLNWKFMPLGLLCYGRGAKWGMAMKWFGFPLVPVSMQAEGRG